MAPRERTSLIFFFFKVPPKMYKDELELRIKMTKIAIKFVMIYETKLNNKYKYA